MDETTPKEPAAPAVGIPVERMVRPLPPQREGQYLTMTICGLSDDPAERGHWSSPAHVQWRIDKAVAAERERCAKLCDDSNTFDYQDPGGFFAALIRGPVA